MEGFLTFVLFAVLFFYFLSWFMPLFLKWWLKRKFKKMSDYVDSQTKSDTNVYNGGSDKIIDSDVGEYVDFEESKNDGDI